MFSVPLVEDVIALVQRMVCSLTGHRWRDVSKNTQNSGFTVSSTALAAVSLMGNHVLISRLVTRLRLLSV